MTTQVEPFVRFADVYDAIYTARGKDYAAEAAFILDTVGANGKHPPRSLLDVACGTGRHLEHFAKRLNVAGTDASAAMLAVAANALPGVPLQPADMRELDLGWTFDVVTCLFAAVAYLPTTADLHRAVAAMARHVAPGGTLVLHPGVTPGRLTSGQTVEVVAPMPEGVVRRHARAKRDGDALVITFDFEVERRGKISSFTEVHRMSLFTDAEYRAAFAAVGMTAKHVEPWPGPRGVYFGRAQRVIGGVR